MSWIILIILILLAIYGVSTYNRIQVLQNRFKNAWSQIDVQLKRRNDLIPNLVETVKGYAAHEKEIFEKVSEARSQMLQAGNVEDTAKASNKLSAALRSVFAIAENYPDLKASQNFQMLQQQLSEIESKIAYARQFYNDSVLKYNNALETFPGSLFAGPMNKKTQTYFEVPETERQAPKVSFTS
jgi:LemA protein